MKHQQLRHTYFMRFLHAVGIVMRAGGPRGSVMLYSSNLSKSVQPEKLAGMKVSEGSKASFAVG